MYQPLLNLPKNRSFFLFGARNTGKSTLIEAQFTTDHCIWFDLLDTSLQEQFVKALAPFGKFLEVAAQSNGKIINFAKIAKDVGIDDKTAKAYFELLEDTHNQ